MLVLPKYNQFSCLRTKVVLGDVLSLFVVVSILNYPMIQYVNFHEIQVETVQDKFMAVSGLPEPCTDQARCIARLALDMMELAMDVAIDGVPVVIKMFKLTTSS